MCLAIPGKVSEMFEADGLKMGKIDYDGVINEACLEYVPDVSVGQYVIVHAGFALNTVDEDEAHKSLELFEQIAEKSTEKGD